MISQLVVTPDRNRADLVGDVQTAWNTFATAIPNHPLANIPTRFNSEWPDDAEAVARAVAELAADPANDAGKIVLGQRCLDAAYPTEHRNLTLLHESIHLTLQSGTHRERYRLVDEARKLLMRQHNRTYRGPSDAEVHAYHRLRFGFEFVNMPDEIWAELYLRDNYQGLFDTRMAQYLALRDDPARRGNHVALQPCIRKFHLLNEWFTLELARRLDNDAARVRRIGELQDGWRTDLVAVIGDDDARDLLARAAALLPADAGAINPAEFDQFFNDIMATPLPN